MRTVTSVSAMQHLARRWVRQGVRVALVPTMGYLHAGHLSLVSHARRWAGRQGKVIVSIYVNPTQFGPREDFSRYPRDFSRDAQLCREAGVDFIFAPSDQEMYPGRSEGRYSTYVVKEQLSRGMEGASRPTHFRGVTTVVAKLFNIVQPGLAVFGAKDFQQAAIVQRMVNDLNFPLRILVARTFREPDGLAMSSRNRYLEGDLRRQGTVLWRAIQRAQAAVKSARKALPASRLKNDLKRFIEREPGASLDYVEFFERETLEPVSKVARGTHMALAVFLGTTRLIDNAAIG